jgi:hypothetical protein
MLPRFRFLIAFVTFGATAMATPATVVFIEQYCADCHDTETKKGGLDLTSLAWDVEKRENFEEWVKVFDLTTKGEMPPKKKDRPEAGAARAFLASIGGGLGADESQRQAQQGRTILRRLNRTEYERTMHDLLGIETPLAALLPADTPTHGFDTVAEGLRLSMLQIEKYLEAADVALDAAIELSPEPEHGTKRYFFKDEKNVRTNLDKPLESPAEDKSGKKHRHLFRQLDDAVVYFNEGYPAAEVRQFSSKAAGLYKIRISGYGYQSDGRPIPMRVYTDNYREKQLLGWFEMPADAPRVVELTVKLSGRVNLRIEPNETGLDAKNQGLYQVPVAEFTGPGLALQWVEVEGPLLESWPPVSVQNLFGETPVTKIEDTRKNRDKRIAYELAPNDPKAAAKAALERFATRAFRRPLEPGDADRFVQLAAEKLDAGESFINAVRIGVRGILTAPQFFLFDERPGRLDDYALASRLSYFLWSSMPDEELLRLAAKGALHEPKTLRAQTERMLGSDKARAFVENFTGQWLDLRNIDATSPDMRLYPEFDERLRVSMVQETEAFFGELLRQNLSVSNLIQSDFAMLNSRLALHYGIPEITGEQMRKVKLPADCPRGGILTQASVLKVTANGTTTSPVLRGAWVMKKLLGEPPAPPPPNTGTIEPDTRGATTVREQLAKHRSMESCAGCHAKMDPPGFALESFDVIGGFRERYRSQGAGDQTTVQNTRGRKLYIKLGPPVDPTGELADGQRFTGISDFKQLLLAQQDKVLSALAKNLVIYSTGASISFADRTAVDQLVAQTKAQGSGLRSLVHEVVQSPLFLSK